MLEYLLSYRKVREKPFLMFLWAFIICLVSVFISASLKMSIGVDAGFMAVVFTIIPSVLFITSIIMKEEEMDEAAVKKHLKIGFWGRHGEDILILLLFFFGLTAAFSVSYHFVDAGGDEFYQSQSTKISQIVGMTGKATGMEVDTRAAFMEAIFVNNMNVMFFSFLFSFIFGAGAIFIITWNASVLGVRIGQLSETAWHIPIRTLPYLPHGILEIGGYLCAALSGGILSFALIRATRSKRLEVLQYVVIDSAKIMLLAVALIFLGAVVEVYM